jgi:hypothetical protein
MVLLASDLAHALEANLVAEEQDHATDEGYDGEVPVAKSSCCSDGGHVADCMGC